LNEIPAIHLDNGKNLHALINHISSEAPPWEMLKVTVVMT